MGGDLSLDVFESESRIPSLPVGHGEDSAAYSLAQTALRFQALVEVSVDAYYDWHVATDLNEFSEQMDALLGLAPGALLRTGDGWQERVHPDDLAAVRAAFQRSLSTRGRLSVEYRMRREDGRYITVEDRARVLTDACGKATELVGTIRDITAERAAFHALRNASNLHRALFSETSNPTFHTDAWGRIIEANVAALRLLERRPEQLLHTHFADLLDGSEVPTDLAAFSPAGIEVRLPTPHGLRHLLLTCAGTETAGERHYFLSGTDITELVSLQKALQASQAALQSQAQSLLDRNTALRVLMEQRDADRRSVEDRLASTVRELALPALDQLQRSLAGKRELLQASALRDSILGIINSLDDVDPDSPGAGVHLTRRETEILTLVRSGRGTAEIAEALVLSPATVSFHRRNIRRKLGLSQHGMHLSTYLSTTRIDQSTP